MTEDLILPFDIIAQACRETKSTVILIGGQAVGVRGYQRVTLDVDFMITETDYEKLKPAIFTAGYQEAARTNVAVKLRAESNDFLDIDFMFVEAGTFQAIEKECTAEVFQGSKFLAERFKSLCLKFGTPELYKKILHYAK